MTRNLGCQTEAVSVRVVGKTALILACIAFVAALIPTGMFVAMGLAGFAATMGLLTFRQRDAAAWARLAGAGALTIAIIALLLATGRFALTWWALGRLADIL